MGVSSVLVSLLQIFRAQQTKSKDGRQGRCFDRAVNMSRNKRIIDGCKNKLKESTSKSNGLSEGTERLVSSWTIKPSLCLPQNDFDLAQIQHQHLQQLVSSVFWTKVATIASYHFYFLSARICFNNISSRWHSYLFFVIFVVGVCFKNIQPFLVIVAANICFISILK
ncbi:uncharacterized protein LOC111283176 [Durio zibethinus]|uniref:Uncharacterized protein LOC111283176 n=1 Tax=Durio zibethinus TaxID=66656 RepID=A0A6P5XGF0_DURZI|nr:uncharacterized protein LOC111283176 [Durio zibethinus]